MMQECHLLTKHLLPLFFFFSLLAFFRSFSCAELAEQTIRACGRAQAQAQPRLLQHAGSLGRASSPAASEHPAARSCLLVLWPLSLPPRHSVLSLSLRWLSPSLTARTGVVEGYA